MMFYSITANVIEITADGGTITKGIPTFYLNSDVQGITRVEHAEQIALSILNPFEDTTLKVDMCVLPVYPEN